MKATSTIASTLNSTETKKVMRKVELGTYSTGVRMVRGSILLWTMLGETHLRVWNGPIDRTENEGQRIDLEDVKSRLVDVLESHEITPYKLGLVDDNCPELNYSTREFKVHKLRDDGTYSKSTQTTVGPKGNGVWIRATIVQKPNQKASVFVLRDPYWHRLEHNYILSDGKRYLHVEVRYGSKFPGSVLGQLDQVFGERIDRW